MRRVLKRWPEEGAAAAVGLGRTDPDERVQQQGGRNPFNRKGKLQSPPVMEPAALHEGMSPLLLQVFKPGTANHGG